MMVSNGTRVALKANPPSPATELPSPAELTSNSDPSPAPVSGASEPQLALNQKPEPEPEVLKQQALYQECRV